MANNLVEPSLMNEQVLNNVDQFMPVSNIEHHMQTFAELRLHRILDTFQQLISDPEGALGQLWEISSWQQQEQSSSQQAEEQLSEMESTYYSPLLSESSAGHHTSSSPIVQAQYQNTYTYFSTLTMTILYLVMAPTFQFFLFDQFNGFATIDIIWFFISYTIGIYVIIIIVGSETMQKIFLFWSHYMQGMALVLILLNAILFLQTMYYWCDEVEFDNHRNEKGEHAMDLASWEVLQTIPTMAYLALCYLFLVEVKEHYVNQDGSLAVLVISAYAAEVTSAAEVALTVVNGWLATLYAWTYAALFIYLNPVAWLEWSFQRVTEIVKWLRTVLPSN